MIYIVHTYRAIGGGAAGTARAAPLFVANVEKTCSVQYCYLRSKNILDLSHSNKLLKHQKTIILLRVFKHVCTKLTNASTYF